MIGIAQCQLDHRQALEVVRNRQCIDHAHAAMQLYRLREQMQ